MKTRARAIGLSLKRLAATVGIDPSTAYRGARGANDTLSSNKEALAGALFSAEIKLRDYLLKLHPLDGAAS